MRVLGQCPFVSSFCPPPCPSPPISSSFSQPAISRRASYISLLLVRPAPLLARCSSYLSTSHPFVCSSLLFRDKSDSALHHNKLLLINRTAAANLGLSWTSPAYGSMYPTKQATTAAALTNVGHDRQSLVVKPLC